MPVESELKTALVDVRKAYRLLYYYTTRLIDLAQVISGHFDVDYYFYQVRPQSPAGWSRLLGGPMTLSSWAWLLSYDFSILYLPKGADPNQPKAGQWMLELRFLTDTAYDSLNEPDAAPDGLQKPEESCSVLDINAFVCTKDCTFNWHGDLYSRSPWPDDEKVVTSDDGLVKVLGVRSDLADLGREEAIRNFVAKFRRRLSAEGVDPGREPEERA